jgi:hypothetical protein
MKLQQETNSSTNILHFLNTQWYTCRMATTKTTKKAPAKTTKAVSKAPLKASAKSTTKSQPAVAKTQSQVAKSQNFTINDLKKKAFDPANRRSLILAGVIVVAAVVVYFGKSLLIAATVNGQPVSRVSIIKDLEKQSGKAALDAVVTRMLVMQEAKKKNIDATSKEIDTEIAKIKKQFADQGQNLDALLATQGLTQEKFKEEVKIQLLVTKILGAQAKVTDKEFNDFMAKNADLIKDEKDQNTAKANLRAQMEQQKLAQKYQEWIANIKKNAKITTFVNY